MGISPRATNHDITVAEGMVVSNEPGYYEDGKYGIRIENVIVCKRAETKYNFGGKGYLGFEHFTMVSHTLAIDRPIGMAPCWDLHGPWPCDKS